MKDKLQELTWKKMIASIMSSRGWPVLQRCPKGYPPGVASEISESSEVSSRFTFQGYLQGFLNNVFQGCPLSESTLPISLFTQVFFTKLHR
jgi:hypothetical protein